MGKYTIAVLLIVIASFAISVNGNPWKRIIEIGDGYIVGEGKVTHAVAKEMCAMAKKKLLSIETREVDENVLILLDKHGVTDALWTSGENDPKGLDTPRSLYDWRWGNGKLLFYSRWIPTRPRIDGKYCLALEEQKFDRGWVDISCTNLLLPICE